MIDLNTIKIATPCSVPWETMSGNERSRHCGLCDLNVYNIASMTPDEIRTTILEKEGRKCIRLLKRADGTVITRDCPVGVSKYRKRMGKRAAAVFGTILGFFTIGYSQQNPPPERSSTSAKRIVLNGKGVIKGVVTDPHGAVIPGVKIELYQEGRKNPLKTTSDKNGSFQFIDLPAGKFELKFKSDLFKLTVVEDIAISASDTRSIEITMELDGTVELVGVVAIGEDMLELTTTSGAIERVISSKVMKNLPLR